MNRVELLEQLQQARHVFAENERLVQLQRERIAQEDHDGSDSSASNRQLEALLQERVALGLTIQELEQQLGLENEA